MKILRSVYEHIRTTIGARRPEEGGMLLTNDGGITITQFIEDSHGSCSGTIYSPNVDFLNKEIKNSRNKGTYFVGIVHSHPYGVTGLSMGRRGNRKYNGYTVSDEEAIYKLFQGMRGTNKLYFPVVQSSYGGGQFSMRMFCAIKRLDGNISIYEESVEIVEPNSLLWAKPLWEKELGCEVWNGCAAIIVGLENSAGCAEKLAISGIANFVLIDNARFTIEDLGANNGVYFSDINTYKVDAVARSIKRYNPFANIRIIRSALDEDVSDCIFQDWIEGLNPAKTTICLCTTDRSICKRAKAVARKLKMIVVEAVKHDNVIETFMLKPSQGRAFRLKFYYINNTIKEEVSETVLNAARRDAVLASFEQQNTVKGGMATSMGKQVKNSINKWDGLYPANVIRQKTVVVVGCGGSRSYVENLVRSGIRRFVLIDGDTYSSTNTQTQMAYINELGKNKAQAMAERLRLIDPDVEVVVIKHMLDEKITDQLFASWVGPIIKERPLDVLIAACTDNFYAQARCSRLALKYGTTFLEAGIYPGGRVLEIIFFHPAVSKVCPRCMLKNRYDLHLNSNTVPTPASSAGTSVFFTEELNAKKGYISLGLLLYHVDGADARYANFLDDNKWVSHKGKHVEDRNFMFYTLDNHLEKSTGIKAYHLFDKWGRLLGHRYQVGISYFIKKKPRRHCPDCGGKGNLMIVKGTIPDTREGLYANRRNKK